MLQNDYSITPSLVAAMPGIDNLQFIPLISSEDVLAASPNFVFGGQPDGQGILRNQTGRGFTLISNHEIYRSVSRVTLDKNLRPVNGEYIVNGNGGQWRLCSATLATPQEHGFGPLFLTAGESGEESMVHGIDPFGPVGDVSRTDRVLPALGKASMENAVPLPKQAYPGKTVVVIGEDQSPASSHLSAGQLSMYLSNSVGDLSNGKFYELRRTNLDPIETNMVMGTGYDVEFAEVSNAANKTGKQINDDAYALNAIRFARIEDVDYRKGMNANGREIYFVATGVANARTTPVTGYTMWGRLYKLVLDANNPLKGKLEVVMDGSEGKWNATPGKDMVNPDNVCVTENFVYVQEDSDSYYTANTHDAYVWLYEIGTGNYKPVITMDHRRTDPVFNAKFNPSNDTRLGSWEYGAMLDISDITGINGTFLLNIHSHTWTSPNFANPDGSGTASQTEGGQTLIVRGLPR